MNAIVKKIDGQYHIFTEQMQPLFKRTWRTANGAKRYAVRNGYTLINTPAIVNAAILTKATGKQPYLLIVDGKTYPFHTRRAAIIYNRSRFYLPIIDYTEQ